MLIDRYLLDVGKIYDTKDSFNTDIKCTWSMGWYYRIAGGDG